MKQILFIFVFLLNFVQLTALEVSKKKIEFLVEHTTKNITGVCNEIQLEKPNIQISRAKFVLKSPFELKISLLKITSGDSNRDSHIQEIFGYPETPYIQVKVESIQTSKSNDATYTINGKLTIHGNTREFSSDAIVKPLEAGEYQVSGSVFVKFSEYNLENPSLLFMKAKDDIQINYRFELK